MKKRADTLRSTPLAREYAKSFAAATGLTLSIEAPGEFHPDNLQLPDCCRALLAQGKTCEKCDETHVGLQSNATRTAKCFMGLTSTAVPVVVQDQAVAYLHTGHAAVNGDASKRNDGATRVSRGQYEGAVHLLEIFARQLSANMPAPTDGSPYPAIDRAALEIRQSPEKSWRLNDLARQAKMNPAYFSEMFRQRLGITLTKFIAGARVDKARQLLVNTEMKIIEIAYAAGFGSVSQFNRVFAAATGTTPSEFRKTSR